MTVYIVRAAFPDQVFKYENVVGIEVLKGTIALLMPEKPWEISAGVFIMDAIKVEVV